MYVFGPISSLIGFTGWFGGGLKWQRFSRWWEIKAFFLPICLPAGLTESSPSLFGCLVLLGPREGWVCLRATLYSLIFALFEDRGLPGLSNLLEPGDSSFVSFCIMMHLFELIETPFS